MILFEQTGKIGIIRINRPEKRNSLNPKLVNLLLQKFGECVLDEAIASIIISGVDKIFCAGADLQYLSELSGYSVIENDSDSEHIAKLFSSVYNCNKPVIAAVNGAAIAGGCGLASVCDYIIADQEFAKFGYSEVKIGFLPAIVSYYLIKRIGESKARQLLISGLVINSAEALKINLADFISQNVIEDAVKLAEKLNKNSLESIKATKKMIRTISGLSEDLALQILTKENVISRTTTDFKKGVATFLNKTINIDILFKKET